ncbi:hypothetical protein QBC39DRAFT_334942 [Podospora conica]|nr:hypothetical protein QBC39DRAFT_334942 [Schizothecium conicum]
MPIRQTERTTLVPFKALSRTPDARYTIKKASSIEERETGTPKKRVDVERNPGPREFKLLSKGFTYSVTPRRKIKPLVRTTKRIESLRETIKIDRAIIKEDYILDLPRNISLTRREYY